MPLDADLNRTDYQLLLTEAQTGITFTDIALNEVDLGESGDEDKIIRNTANGRTAYETLMRLKDRVVINEESTGVLEKLIDQLRKNLRELGEII